MTKEFFERGKQIARWADNNMAKYEALKMAIEALEKLARLGNGDSYGNSDGNCIAISALKAITFTLAQPAQEPEYVYVNPVTKDMYYLTKAEQPAQEPVGFTITGKLGDRCSFKSTELKKGDTVYTHLAPSWVGLDAVEISAFKRKFFNVVIGDTTKFVRAIEQKLKTKNGFSALKEKNT